MRFNKFVLRFIWNSLLILLIAISGCQEREKIYKATIHKFPNPVDTRSKDITYQKRQLFEEAGVFASNSFDGARLNDFEVVNDTLYRATISPENSPINHSPWYAFKIWSEEDKTVYVELTYSEHFHRYLPKLSSDGNTWSPLDSNRMNLAIDSVNMILKLDLNKDTLWVAAQEIVSHAKVGEWVDKLARNNFVTEGNAGNSPMGKDLYFLDITNGSNKDKPAIVLLSRQHPPEVTGFFCMQAFVETIVEEGISNGFLEKYRVLVYPLLNPDGVDLGHFRHNTGGVDLNRDWAEYNQPEIRQVADHIVSEVSANDNTVLLGLDFHSTWKDVYYTFDETVQTNLPDFTDSWLEKIRVELNVEALNIDPSGIGSPVSKGWFYKQFEAESITYEIGDGTPREYINSKGIISARAMMEVLMEH